MVYQRTVADICSLDGAILLQWIWAHQPGPSTPYRASLAALAQQLGWSKPRIARTANRLIEYGYLANLAKDTDTSKWKVVKIP
jgi:DNA-binding IclR family transcriptional regulator